MAGTSSSAEADLINEIAHEQQELCNQAREYRKCSLSERIAKATAYRSKQLRRWEERAYPILLDIVSKGAPKTTRVQFDGSYSLIDASSRDDIEEVRLLLEKGADPNSVNFDGLSALHQCCIEDSPEIAQVLVDFGADVNLRDNEWWTPLHAAASCGLQHIVELLLDNGACVAVLNSDGDLPIDMADTAAIFDLLKDAQIEQGYSEEDIAFQRYELEENMMTDFQKGVMKVTDRDRVQATPLHVAAAHGLEKIAELLLREGADANAKDSDDWTPAHAASCWGHAGVMTVLSKYGADFDARTKNYDTPYSLTEDSDLQEVIMELKLKAVEKMSAKRSIRAKRMTISSRGHSVKRSTLERKKSLSRHEAKNEAMQRVQAEERMRTAVGAEFEEEPKASQPKASSERDSADRVGDLPLKSLPNSSQQPAPTSPMEQQASTVQLLPPSASSANAQDRKKKGGGSGNEQDKDSGCCTIL